MRSLEFEAHLEFNVNITNENGERLLSSAIRKCDTGAVQTLVNAGPLESATTLRWPSVKPSNQTPTLHSATKLGSTDIMKLLLRNESLKVNQFQLHRLISVHFALLYSQFPVLEILLASLSVGISTAMKN
jgi:ankyrin repeat protein